MVNTVMSMAGSWQRIRLPRGEWFYEPNHPLGPAGGFGEVFEGRSSSEAPVAIKRLKLSVGAAAHRELEIAEQLAGKTFLHVLGVLDSGEDADGGGYFVVMPKADRSLADELENRGPLPQVDAVDILRQIAEGLRELDILIHRDLKPGNVLYHDSQWKIADFGIAKFVENSTSLNTVRDFLSHPYAAPEQWKGEQTTHATDVYALSCVAYVLLRGQPPFPGPDYQKQHTSDSPPLLVEADPRLRAIITAGLRKPQSGRPSLDRIISVLREVAENRSVASPVIAALQTVNAIEVERVSALAAEAERARHEQAERNALIDAGDTILLNVIHSLGEIALHNAPEARIDLSNPAKLVLMMGSYAALSIELQGGIPPNALFPNSKWCVVAIGRIEARQTKPHEWVYGATLWYMQLKPNTGYRWYEVSYRRHPLFHEGLVSGPFAIQSIGDQIYNHADWAAAPGTHEIEIEFGPSAIDDEDLQLFVERWLQRLAQAYQGCLRPF